MDTRKSWTGLLKEELKNSPLASNVVFGFILTGLEKLVEVEFECPCDPEWNLWFSLAFFIIPAVMAFMLMLIIQGCRCNKDWGETFSLSSLVPAIVWLILLFFDGQYYACAVTDWKGRFVLLEEKAKQKWCEPNGEDVAKKEELMLRSQKMFVFSQVSSFCLPARFSNLCFVILMSSTFIYFREHTDSIYGLWTLSYLF